MSTYPHNPTPPSDDPEVLRREIEQTRAELARDVDALGDAASPANVARRQAEKVTDKVRGAGHSMKEKVMGSDDPYGSGTGSRVGDAAGSAQQTLASAPAAARRQTRGNPLAAGAVALAAGWLVGSLLPASEKERELAVTAKEQVRDSGVVEEAKTVAQQVVEDVKPQAQEAVESVKESASEGVQHVKDDAGTATEQVKGSAQESKDTVQEQREQQG